MGYASYATMARGFGPGFDAPLIVAAKLPAPGASTAGLRRRDRAHTGDRGASPRSWSAGTAQAAMLVAYPTTGEQDSRHQRAGQPAPR